MPEAQGRKLAGRYFKSWEVVADWGRGSVGNSKRRGKSADCRFGRNCQDPVNWLISGNRLFGIQRVGCQQKQEGLCGLWAIVVSLPGKS